MKENLVYTIRQGGSYAIGTMIDQYLSDEDVTTLYEKWKDKWVLPLEYRGGQKIITCDMVASVPITELVEVYGKKLATRLIEAANHAPTL